MTDHYAGTAAGWARSVSRVYGPLARELVAASPHPADRAVTLDLGAGTGLVSAALSAVGARPVALDRSPDMLRWRRAERPPAAVADATRLPLRTDAVQAAFAAFLLNHLPDPAPALRELARVTRPGGAVLATVYANSGTSAVRDRVDEVALAHGFRWPDWYLQLRDVWAPRMGTAEAMADAARAAGLVAARAVEYDSDVGLDRAGGLRRLPLPAGALPRVDLPAAGRPAGGAAGGRDRRHRADHGAVPAADRAGWSPWRRDAAARLADRRSGWCAGSGEGGGHGTGG